MTPPTLPPEIAAVLEEAPWIINGMIDAPHPMYRYQVVLKDDPTCFGEPCSYNQARAEANRLNQLHRNQRVAALIAEREKAIDAEHLETLKFERDAIVSVLQSQKYLCCSYERSYKENHARNGADCLQAKASKTVWDEYREKHIPRTERFIAALNAALEKAGVR